MANRGKTERTVQSAHGTFKIVKQSKHHTVIYPQELDWGAALDRFPTYRDAFTHVMHVTEQAAMRDAGEPDARHDALLAQESATVRRDP